MNYVLYELFSGEFWSNHGQTDGQKVMHMSIPCISTTVLKNGKPATYLRQQPFHYNSGFTKIPILGLFEQF